MSWDFNENYIFGFRRHHTLMPWTWLAWLISFKLKNLQRLCDLLIWHPHSALQKDYRGHLKSMLQVWWILFLLLLPTAAFTQPGAPTWDDLWREDSEKADVIWEIPLPAHRQGSPSAHAAAELHEGHQQGVALPGVVRSTPSHGIFVPRMLNWCCESCASFVSVSYCIYLHAEMEFTS